MLFEEIEVVHPSAGSGQRGRSKLRIAACLLALALVASGCGGSSDSEGAESDAVSEATAAPEVDAGEAPVDEGEPAEESAAEESVEEPATEEPAAEEAAGGDTSCVVGAWVLSASEMNAYYDELGAAMGSAGGGVDFSISGDTRLDLNADGTYLYSPDFDLEMDMDGVSGVGEASGSLAGAYAIEDGIMTTTVERDDIDMVITVAGITMSGTDLGMDVGTLAPISSAPIECVSGSPVIGFELPDTDVRVPVTLTPA